MIPKFSHLTWRVLHVCNHCRDLADNFVTEHVLCQRSISRQCEAEILNARFRRPAHGLPRRSQFVSCWTTDINGFALRKPVDIDFEVHPSGEDLFSMRPNVADSKSRTQQSRLVASGQAFQFLAYETRAFHGAPEFPDELRSTKSAKQISRTANRPF